MDGTSTAAGVAGPRRRILVIEDDPGIRALLESTLTPSGYDLATAATGQEAFTAVAQFDPDLLIVDVMLPDIDGYEITRILRGAGLTAPILFLTARAESGDIVAGLRAGGDDYVVKPFDIDELLLRIRGILRRFHPGDTIEAYAQESVLAFADLRLDQRSREVRRGGRTIALTPTEFKLLAFLMTRANQLVSKQQIIGQVWSYDFAGELRIVDTYVKYLRRKVDCFDPPLLHTVRGIGYCLRLPPDDQPERES